LQHNKHYQRHLRFIVTQKKIFHRCNKISGICLFYMARLHQTSSHGGDDCIYRWGYNKLWFGPEKQPVRCDAQHPRTDILRLFLHTIQSRGPSVRQPCVALRVLCQSAGETNSGCLGLAARAINFSSFCRGCPICILCINFQ